MKNDFLKALSNLYDELGFDDPNVIEDIKNDYLSEHTGRSGRDILWYRDEVNDIAIFCDTCEFLKDNGKETELC